MMTDTAFLQSARAIVQYLDHAADQRALSPDDRCALASIAIVEFLSRHKRSPVAAVEYLRTVADLMERQYLSIESTC